MSDLLRVEAIDVAIDAMGVLRGFSMSVAPSEMVGLVGRNGAGKTTLLRSVMGHLAPLRGRILLFDQPMQKESVHSRAALGVGYMPEHRQLVPELTVEENILLPVWVSRTLKRQERLDFVYGFLPELVPMRDRSALLLSGGQQKLVALARAMAVGTRLLLLDEPFEGVAPVLSERLSEVIAGLKRERLGVLIAQSNMNHANRLFDRSVVIERGTNMDDDRMAALPGP